MTGSDDSTQDAEGAREPAPPAAATARALGPARALPPPLPPPPLRTMAGGLLDSLRLAVVMLDTSGRVLLWSPLAEEMLGWAGEHIVGRRVGTLLAAGARPSARGAPRSGAVSGPGPAEGILEELLRSGSWDGVLWLRHRDGHSVQVEARASMLVDGDGRQFVLASVAETSRIRTLEHDLAALDPLFDSSPLGVAIFDTDLRYIRVNDALTRMNGVPRERTLGRRVDEVVHKGAADELAALQRHVLATGRAVIDVVIPGRDGGWRSVSYHRLEDGAGRVLGISCTVMDVTERQHSAAKIERARRRLALLNDVGSRLADLLDVRRIAEQLAQTVVPRFSDYSGVILHTAVPDGGELPGAPYGETTRMRQLGIGAIKEGPLVERMLGIGKTIQVDRASIFGAVLHTGRPALVQSPRELRDTITTYPGDPKVQAAVDLGIHSLIVAPLVARGIVLGLLVVSRAGGREPFDAEDLALATELADRSAAALDNARLYIREREGALMLQRSLLPQSVPEPPGVELAFRYVPGSSGAAAGGDWFDVIPLAGGRVALVVGDVIGHGLRAAATMGRLRTAVRTLAAMEMAPEELLRRVDDLGDDLAGDTAEGWTATCVYAVYDPSTRRLTVARAGHPPPVLVVPGTGRTEGTAGTAVTDPADPVKEVRLMDIPAGVPLGVGGVEFESVELDVPDGAVLVLYTDGLIEARDEDIDVGLERLRAVLAARPPHSLEATCDDLLATLAHGREPDDVALLVARLGGLPEGSTASWTFAAEPSAVRHARALVRDTLARWELRELTDVTALLVSELVTNSLRHAHGPIGVRVVRGSSLLVEVSDPLPDPPRERSAGAEDEGGRGLQLVARASRRWGTRHGPPGKTVWFELALPVPA
ncbi:SpoIIE family protein phosphatase [Streptomyces sp. NPDC088732]|uniref:SpoIIE family protein phosphatase n=1 Tax=Streptomyces sp. NPDC088732 TaxID=3365879 RepID=UPI0038027B69